MAGDMWLCFEQKQFMETNAAPELYRGNVAKQHEVATANLPGSE